MDSLNRGKFIAYLAAAEALLYCSEHTRSLSKILNHIRTSLPEEIPPEMITAIADVMKEAVRIADSEVMKKEDVGCLFYSLENRFLSLKVE